jgi:membrane fusion protein (multidrug efflux system)
MLDDVPGDRRGGHDFLSLPENRPRADGPAETEPRADEQRPGAPVRERPREIPPDEPARRAPASDEPVSRPDKPEAAHGDDGGKGGDDTKKAARRTPWMWIILGIVILAAIIGGGYYWYSTRNLESTDDAYTDGNAITIAPQVSGIVVDLAVNDNQLLHAGQTIIKIDPRDYIAARDKARGQLDSAQGQLAGSQAALAVARKNFPARLLAAQANLQSAQAALAKAEADDRRQHAVSRAATTATQIDEADAALLQARAQVAQAQAAVTEADPVQENINQSAAVPSQIQGDVEQAKAQLDQAELNLSYTTVTAPQDGWVTKRNVDKGNYVTAGNSIMSLVSPKVWVTANFKENQLDRIRPGQKVDISVDAYPGLKLEGHVDSIQLGTGSKFSAFPAENATGNYVKIVQRVPVKIVIDSGLDPNLPLPLGLSVNPTIHLK